MAHQYAVVPTNQFLSYGLNNATALYLLLSEKASGKSGAETSVTPESTLRDTKSWVDATHELW